MTKKDIFLFLCFFVLCFVLFFLFLFCWLFFILSFAVCVFLVQYFIYTFLRIRQYCEGKRSCQLLLAWVFSLFGLIGFQSKTNGGFSEN